MRKPILPIISAAIIFTLATLGIPYLHPDAFGTRGEPDESSSPKKSGGGIGGLFKAIGRLFGTRKKNDKPATVAEIKADDKTDKDTAGKKQAKPDIKRMTEKDARSFETTVTAEVVYGPTPAAQKAETSELTAEQHLARGRALLNDGYSTAAIGAFSTAISINPKLTEAYRLSAIAYARIGMAKKAGQEYTKANDGSGDNPKLLNDLGYALYQNGSYKQAVKHLKRAAKLSPNNQLIRNNLALAQFRRGNYDDAKKNFIAAGGEFDGHFNMAIMFRRTGQQERAIREFEIARRINPSPIVLAQLASLYEQTGRTAEAQEARGVAPAAGSQSVTAVTGTQK